MDDKITIIEGPPPTFEAVQDGWSLSLLESPSLGNVAITRLRTYNGPSLVERCHRAWRNMQTIHLEYRSPEGLESQAPILAARTVESLDGQLLLLWVRLDEEEIPDDVGDEDSDSEFDDPNWSP